MTALAIESSTWADGAKLVTVYKTSGRRARLIRGVRGGVACRDGASGLRHQSTAGGLAGATTASLVGPLTYIRRAETPAAARRARLGQLARVVGQACFGLVWAAGVVVAGWVMLAGAAVPTVAAHLS